MRACLSQMPNLACGHVVSVTYQVEVNILIELEDCQFAVLLLPAGRGQTASPASG